MIKNLLNADEEPPEGTKVIIEDTIVGAPATGEAFSKPVENPPNLETRPAFEIPGNEQSSTHPEEETAETAPLDEKTESFDALMADIENLEPEELDRLERELETAGLNKPASAAATEPVTVPAATAQQPEAPPVEAKTPPIAPVVQTAENAASNRAPEPTIFQNDYTAPTTAETIRNSGLAWSAGVVLFGSVIFMMIFGWFADLLLGSSPWGILVGIVLGGLIGFVQFFRITSQIFRK